MSVVFSLEVIFRILTSSTSDVRRISVGLIDTEDSLLNVDPKGRDAIYFILRSFFILSSVCLLTEKENENKLIDGHSFHLISMRIQTVSLRETV